MTEIVNIEHGNPVPVELRSRLVKAFTRISHVTGEATNDVSARVQDFYDQQESDWYHLGCPDHRDFEALAYIVTAAGFLNGMAHGSAVKLLRLAIAEIEESGR